MKKLKNWIIPILAVVALILFVINVKQCSTINDNNNQSEETDTVYVDKVIEVPKPYNVYVKPDVVTYYQKDTVRIHYNELVYLNDTMILFNNDLDSLKISKWYLLQHPTEDKLISFKLDRSNLKLQLLQIDGNPVEKDYSLDLDRYKYIYVEKKLTQKKDFHLQVRPSVMYSYRVIHKLHDLDLSLNFKTTNFNYVVGLNGFVYPSSDLTIGGDVKLSIQYNF